MFKARSILAALALAIAVLGAGSAPAAACTTPVGVATNAWQSGNCC